MTRLSRPRLDEDSERAGPEIVSRDGAVDVSTKRNRPSAPRTGRAAARRDLARAIDSLAIVVIFAVAAQIANASVWTTAAVAVAVFLVAGGTARIFLNVMSRSQAWRRSAGTAACVVSGLLLIWPDIWGANRVLLIASGLLATVVPVLHREVSGGIEAPLFGRARTPVRAVLVGDAASIAEFEELTRESTRLVVAARLITDTTANDVRVPIQTADEAVALVEAEKLDRVVIIASSPGYPAVKAMVRRVTLRGVGVELVTGATSVSPGRMSTGHIGEFATLRIQGGLNGRRRRLVKRVFDLVVATLILAVTAPIWIVAAIAIRLDSSGPILYRQHRLGRGGRQFVMLKFRSMQSDADTRLIDLTDQNNADGPLFKIKDDPRVTPVGAILRRLSLDELPQLLNVLRGEMSLVGPRPALPSEADGWTPELFDRVEVSPGVTGPWQVSGRSDLSFEDYWRLDLYYVDNWDLWLDVCILAKTLPAIVSGRGAY